MLEAYVWGREFQLGYYKHPPLWAWIAGAWFEVFPRMNWSYYLLSALNSAMAVIGVWRLTGLLTKGDYRLAATFLLFATPFYTFSALKYNANTMLLSLWPWTAYFFAKSIENLKLRTGVWFGVCAAAAFLSKYYSVLLLASCVIASFCHPNWRRYYLSASPYVAVAVCAVLVTPHLIWLLTHGFESVEYVKTRSLFPGLTIYRCILTFILGGLAFNAVVAALIIASRRLRPPRGSPAVDPSRQPFLIALAIGPFLLTVLAGLLMHIRLSTNFAIPIFFLFPLLLIQFLRPEPDRLKFFSAGFMAAIFILAIPIAVSVPFLMVKLNKRLSLIPSVEIAREATKRWHESTATPLRIVAGTWPYALATAYYSGDETAEYTGFNAHLAPWITPQRLADHGLLAICARHDDGCNTKARELSLPSTKTVEVSVAREQEGFSMRPETFLLYITPPK